MSSPFTLFVGERTAQSHNLAAGDTLELVFAGRAQEFRILAVADGETRNPGTCHPTCWLQTSGMPRTFLHRYEGLDRIDLFLDEEQAAATVTMLEEELPFSVQIEPPVQPTMPCTS